MGNQVIDMKYHGWKETNLNSFQLIGNADDSGEAGENNGGEEGERANGNGRRFYRRNFRGGNNRRKSDTEGAQSDGGGPGQDGENGGQRRRRNNPRFRRNRPRNNASRSDQVNFPHMLDWVLYSYWIFFSSISPEWRRSSTTERWLDEETPSIASRKIAQHLRTILRTCLEHSTVRCNRTEIYEKSKQYYTLNVNQ